MGTEDIVHPDLVKIALDKARGYQFEEFANAYYPALVGEQFIPLGGNHDGGADAFQDKVHESQTRAGSFYQASIEVEYRSKIRRTVARLREFGRRPRTLTYLTSRPIRHLDVVEDELTAELDVTIRIRDANFVIAHVNDEPGTRAAYWYHLDHLTDFLKAVGGTTLISSGAHSASIAVYVFLEQELSRRSGDTSLVDAVTDSLILWALGGDGSRRKVVHVVGRRA